MSTREDDSSLVVGVYGAWGEGKTTVLDFIKFYLSKGDSIITLDFNPWRYGNEDKMLGYFYKDLLEALGKKEKSLLHKFGIISKRSIDTVATLASKKEIGDLLSGAIPTHTIESLKKRLKRYLKPRIKELLCLLMIWIG